MQFFFSLPNHSLCQRISFVSWPRLRTRGVITDEISSESLLFFFYCADKFNYHYHFTVWRFVKWCGGKQARTHVERVAVLLHMEPPVSFDVSVCVCARVWTCPYGVREKLATPCTSCFSWGMTTQCTHSKKNFLKGQWMQLARLELNLKCLFNPCCCLF